MWRAQNRVRRLIKKIYHKLNPQYKYILSMNDTIINLQKKMESINGEGKYAQIELSDKLFLACDSSIYRYLYLLRYIRENDTVLDFECEYGVGTNLLLKYTPIDKSLCLNSVDYYTRIGNMYYSSDYIEYRTGTFYDLSEKYNIGIFFNERKTCILTEKDIGHFNELLEYGGILALAIDADLEEKMSFLVCPEKLGFEIEAQYYQNIGCPELSCEKKGKSVKIIYLRKNN